MSMVTHVMQVMILSIPDNSELSSVRPEIVPDSFKRGIYA